MLVVKMMFIAKTIKAAKMMFVVKIT